VREQKILNIAHDIPEQAVEVGETTGKLALVSWGSTYGAVNAAVQRSRAAGLPVSHIHLRYMWPMPRNLGELLRGFEHVMVPELNNGQLVRLLRSEYLVPAQPLCKIHGQPFRVAELVRSIGEHFDGRAN
jgi:2-oxoglutarate ferredoxin oxidoreductase subunit alpha